VGRIVFNKEFRKGLRFYVGERYHLKDSALVAIERRKEMAVVSYASCVEIYSAIDSTRLLEKLDQSRSHGIADLSSLDVTDEEFVNYVIPRFRKASWRKLQLCENNISDDSLKALTTALIESGCHLFELDLGWNSISDIGLSLLTQALLRCRLRELIIHSNDITDEGVRSVAAILPTSNLQTLDLCANYITDVGASALASVLKDCPLRALDLSQNSVTDVGSKELVRSMRFSNLQLLNLENNPIESRVIFHEIENLEGLIGSEFKVMIAFCSVVQYPRLGVKSKIRMLPKELIRKLSHVLYAIEKPSCGLQRADTASNENEERNGDS
jgi:hypothetical protein